MFFPTKGANYRAAQKICNDCPVRALCLQYAEANEESEEDIEGMFGGKTPVERRAMRGFAPRHPSKKEKDNGTSNA